MNEWTKRNQDYTLVDGQGAFSIGFAGMDFCEKDLQEMAPLFAAAAQGMADIEAGKIKNPDENRKVTHFSDRASYVSSTLFETVEAFVEDIHSGALQGPTGKKFQAVVVNGIGGSALGPQLMQ
ncbi:MAG: glucose-6-phosphate isomerase, partial [Lentisphaeria bacterium]|nr:glucose-6-phosphate isomerase [Lentisphaeria bacterium]